MIYDLLYDFILTHFFTHSTLSSMSSEVMGVTINFNEYLAHTITIVTMVVFIVILFLLLKWLFKVVSGFILLK